MDSTEEKQKLIDLMVDMSAKYPDQPIALITEGGVLKVGVMSSYKPESDEWALKPINVAKVTEAA